MNRLLTAAMLFCTAGAIAQTPFTTRDSVDINNINAMVLVHGDLWWNPSSMSPHCYFPNGTTKSISSTGAIWMSAYDGSNNLHTSAQMYRVSGSDFWPGPLDGSDTLTYAASQDWAHIWKVKRTDIQHFRHLTALNESTVPASIWTWPAKGNVHASGNGGASLTITTDMAPFVDVNMDGIYEPDMGDYPDIKGDEALWWVYSDNGPAHTETNGRPLKVEVHAMAYAYSRGTAIDNVIYYEYKIQNKSGGDYTNFRVGQFADVDLGDYSDDYIGFDSARALAYVYNGHTPDAVYGSYIPMAGIILLSAQTGSGSSGAGSFMYCSNDNSASGNPHADTEYNNYMRSKIRTGLHATNDMAAPGSGSAGYGSGPSVRFQFTGNPAVPTSWTECNAVNLPGDRRFILSSGDLAVPSGNTVTFVVAQVVTRPDTTHACGDTLSITDIIGVADTATMVYNGPLPPLPDAIANITPSQLSIYPNPAHGILHIRAAAAIEDIAVYNALGQRVQASFTANGNTIDAGIAALPPGMYYVVGKNASGATAAKFLKE